MSPALLGCGLGFTLLMSSCASDNKSLSSQGTEADITESISLDVKKKTYENGLTVLFVQNSKLPIFSYYSYYKVGGKFEQDGITGASHYLEHMMFKGAKKYGPMEFDTLIESNGGSNNAYTTNDLTVYYENLPSKHFGIVADLEADRMQNLLLEKKSFESERNVVLEERKLRYENSDNGKLYLQMMKEVFKGTPYGTSVIGKINDLKSVTRDQIQKYFKTYYAPNNAVIVIVGDLEGSDVFETMENKFGKIPATKDLEKTKAKILKNKFEFKAKFDRSVAMNGTSRTPLFRIGFKSEKIGSQEGFVLDILSSILGDGESSYLNQKFVTSKKPMLSSVGAGNYTLQESGVFMLSGQLLNKVNLSSFKSKLYKSLNQFCKDGITPRALQKVKNQYSAQMFDGLDTNAGIASFIGDREVYYGDYAFYKKEMNVYNRISIDELKSACKKYVTKKNSIFLSIWNKHKK